MKLLSFFRGIGAILAISGALVGCEDADSLSVVKGQLEVPKELRFGAVLLGTTVNLELEVKNTASVPAAVTSIALDSQFPAQFAVDLAPFTIDARSSHFVTVTFDANTIGEFAGTVTFTVDDQTHADNLSTLISGQAVRAVALPSPAVIDFGQISLFGTATRQLVLTNAAQVPVPVSLSALMGPYASHFSVDQSAVTVAAGNVPTIVNVTYNPRTQAQMEATFDVTPCPGCTPVQIILKGSSQGAQLDVTPRMLDFGFTQPGAVTTQAVHVRNVGSENVTLNQVEITPTSDPTFRVDAAASGLVLSPGQGSDIVVEFSPTDLSSYSGVLKLYTDVALQAEVTIPLVGVGGGPVADCSPESLDFGQVALLTRKTMTVTCTNRGTNVRGTNSELQITRVSATPGSGFFAAIPGTQYLSNGQVFRLEVTYSPILLGTNSGTLEIQTNDPNHRIFSIQLSGNVIASVPCVYEVTPLNLEFNRVKVGGAARLAFEFRNLGTEPDQFCTINNLALASQDSSSTASRSGDFLLPQGSISNLAVGPGQTVIVPVEFQPGAEGDGSGTVDFFVNGETGLVHEFVTLHGVGDGSCLELRPVLLDFGVSALLCPISPRHFELVNTCNAAITVSSLSLSSSSSREFSITSATTSFQVPALGTSRVDLAYSPTNLGQDFGTLQIFDANVTHPLVGSLQGQAVSAQTQVDFFPRNDNALQNKIDVLFVIDNSGSMGDEQAALAAGYPAFISGALNNNWDFNIATTTTEICSSPSPGCESGSFFPIGASDRILNRMTPNVAGLFARNVNVGLSGGTESGLEASRLALSAPLINSSNAGFLREAAKLAVIYVTDAEDNPPVRSVGVYRNFLLQLKGGRQDLVSVSAIVGDGSCTGSEGIGNRYMDLTGQFNGVIQPVCAPDWNAILEGLSQTLFGGKSRFDLSRVPSEPTIVVTVDGVAIPRAGAGGVVNWTYDSVQNQVVFTNPIMGQDVSITYQVGCS